MGDGLSDTRSIPISSSKSTYDEYRRLGYSWYSRRTILGEKRMKVFHKKIKKLGKDFYRATDRRSEKEATLEVPRCGYEYYLHEEPRLTKYEKGVRKVVKRSRESESLGLENG